MGLGPQRQQTPRTGLEDAISNLFAGAVNQVAPAAPQTGGAGKGPSLVQQARQKVSGSNTTGAQQIQDLFQNLSIPEYGGQLSAPMNPLQTSSLAAGQGAEAFGQGTSMDAILNLLGMGRPTGAGGAPSSVMDMLKGTPEASSAGFEGILNALDQSRQKSLSTDLNNISERFSASGLRDSTNLADVLGQTAEASRSNFLSQAAQLLPTLTGQRQSALTAAAGAAGQPLSLATQGFGLGTQGQQVEQDPLTRLYQEFTRTQGALLPAILNFAAGAPQITGPGKGSQLLGAGATVGAAAAGKS